ncbi:iron uptake porin [Anthocerotibacter panamensis]|uniref:iron uptake porin n=1 Tax=Anthocerotibacter panamensis TaxID=2857077 RepID=UPI001C4060C1|nr:iron uptake porin [Anthocerotibacter panamensis]
MFTKFAVQRNVFSWMGLFAALAHPVQALPDTSVRQLGGEAPAQVAQVFSVSELTDVTSADWAFLALKSLVERYGCLDGYPDLTFRGQRALTRYEFASGLNTCLQKINEQITAGTQNLVTKDDLSTAGRLEEQFRTELATLRGRTDQLEAKAKNLEGNFFSRITKFTSTAIFSVNGGGAGGNIVPLAQNGGPTRAGTTPNTTFGGRIRFNFDTRFSKETNDLLKIRLSTFPSLGQDTSASLGAGTRSGQLFFGGVAPLAGGTGFVTDGRQAATFDKVWYAFNPFKTAGFRVWVGPRVQVIDVLDRNPYLISDENRFVTTLNLFNPLISGYAHLNTAAGFDWRIAENVSLRALYSAANAGAANGLLPGGGGLTGGLTQLIGELEYRPAKELGLKFQYTRANVPLNAGNRRVFGGSPVLIGSNPLTPVTGTFSTVDAFGFNTDWSISSQVKFFGRVAFASDRVTGAGLDGNLSANTWLVGFEFPDLLSKGNRAGISFGQPIRVTATSGIGTLQADPGTETDLELYYNFRLAKGIELTPDLQLLFNPGNNPNNSVITVGTLRTVFSF